MALCGPTRCACAVDSSSIHIAGNGSTANPYRWESYYHVGAAPLGGDRYVGMEVYSPPTDTLRRWNGNGWQTTLQALTTYAPAYTGFDVIAGLGPSTGTAGWSRSEYTVTAQGEITLGAGFTLSSPLFVSLPAAPRFVDDSDIYTAQPGIRQLGIAAYHQVSTSRIYHGTVDTNITIPGQITFYTAAGWVQVGPDHPFTWAAGDQMWWKITYDAAEEAYVPETNIIVWGPDPVTFGADPLVFTA
jgi:hypothetical protein